MVLMNINGRVNHSDMSINFVLLEFVVCVYKIQQIYTSIYILCVSSIICQ